MARYARISDVLACSDYVSASTSPVMIAFEGDVVVVIESERQRWTETVGVDDSLSRELVTTTASVLTDGGRLAHAAPLRARPRGAPEERDMKVTLKCYPPRNSDG